MEDDTFTALMQREWREQFADDGVHDWKQKWLVDGLRADVRNTPDGMVFAAGPVAYDNGSHSVLWTKADFAGDIRIELDYTRLDTITRFVNILYNRQPARRWDHLPKILRTGQRCARSRI